MKNDLLKLGLAQISPIWLDRTRTIAKVVEYVEKASAEACDLVVFGEAMLPGYPFWVEHTDGARFESEFQKEMYSHYLSQAVNPERGDLDPIRKAAAKGNIHIVLGTIEAAGDRGGHSCYCTLVYVDAQGAIRNTHRKMMPTYEERLVWAQGDGHGLNVYPIGGFKMGALNCWENWMPLARTSLYGLGEDLHIAIWPGNVRNTEDLTRHIARESRSYVASVSGLMTRQDIPSSIPNAEFLKQQLPEQMANGGSCLCDPTGTWVLEPVASQEDLFVATLDQSLVRRERQNFDPVGHYSRPDVLKLSVNRDRQRSVD